MKETRFKDTEIGRIPEDWEATSIEKLCTLKARIGWQGLTTGEYLLQGDYILITGTDFKDGYIDWKNCWYVSKWRYDQDSNIQIKEGDVLISKDGTIGKVAFINSTPGPGTLNSGVFVVRPKQKDIVNQGYLSWIFKSIWFKSFIDQLTAGSTINHLYQKDFVNFKLVYPNDISEQTRIASALTSIDNLISSLDKLIEKKKAIKEGTMQQLLTGKKRLKGFNEPWVEKELGELGTLECVPINPQFFTNCVFAEYSMPSFDEDRNPRFVKGQEMCSSRLAIEGEVLLINKLNVRQKRIWYLNECGNNAVCSGEFLPYKSSKVNLILLRNILLTNKVVNDFVNMSTGTSNSQKRVKPSNVLSYKINIPLDINEQKAIANMLTSMDNEITVLEAKRDKYIKTKQGMMQQLLTGRIRLV